MSNYIPPTMDNYPGYSVETDVFLQNLISQYNTSLDSFTKMKHMNMDRTFSTVRVTMDSAYCNGRTVNFPEAFATWKNCYDANDEYYRLKYRLEQLQTHIRTYIGIMSHYMPNHSNELMAIKLKSFKIE